VHHQAAVVFKLLTQGKDAGQ